jgi:hypothetical protein
MLPDSKQPEDGMDQQAAAELPELDSKIQLLLGRALQCHYDDLVNAPIPDRFLVLLAELESKERGNG